ncbi:MAG: hypothetical protein ABL994_10920, partial [Verrucomicrobiales bacterium]
MKQTIYNLRIVSRTGFPRMFEATPAATEVGAGETQVTAGNTAASGWRKSSDGPSLPEAFKSIPIPIGASIWRKMLA